MTADGDDAAEIMPFIQGYCDAMKQVQEGFGIVFDTAKQVARELNKDFECALQFEVRQYTGTK